MSLLATALAYVSCFCLWGAIGALCLSKRRDVAPRRADLLDRMALALGALGVGALWVCVRVLTGGWLAFG